MATTGTSLSLLLRVIDLDRFKMARNDFGVVAAGDARRGSASISFGTSLFLRSTDLERLKTARNVFGVVAAGDARIGSGDNGGCMSADTILLRLRPRPSDLDRFTTARTDFGVVMAAGVASDGIGSEEG